MSKTKDNKFLNATTTRLKGIKDFLNDGIESQLIGKDTTVEQLLDSIDEMVDINMQIYRDFTTRREKSGQSDYEYTMEEVKAYDEDVRFSEEK